LDFHHFAETAAAPGGIRRSKITPQLRIRQMKTEAVHGHRENALENSNREIRNPPRDWIVADTNRHGRRRRSTAMLLQYSKRNLGRDKKENEKSPQHSSSSYQQTREQARNKNKRSRCHRKRAKIFFEKFKTKSILRDVQIIEKGSKKHRVHDQTPKEKQNKTKSWKTSSAMR
jgi:hypothetical protein